MSNWREILRAQEEDLKRMEEMDAALNEDQEDLDLNIKAILRAGNHRSTGVGLNSQQQGKGTQQKSSISDEMRFDNSTERVRSSQHREVRPTSREQSEGGRGGVHRDRSQVQVQDGVEEFRGDEDEDNEEDNLLISKSEKSMMSPSLKQHQTPDTTARSAIFFVSS
jgi:hypothetical protein